MAGPSYHSGGLKSARSLTAVIRRSDFSLYGDQGNTFPMWLQPWLIIIQGAFGRGWESGKLCHFYDENMNLIWRVDDCMKYLNNALNIVGVFFVVIRLCRYRRAWYRQIEPSDLHVDVGRWGTMNNRTPRITTAFAAPVPLGRLRSHRLPSRHRTRRSSYHTRSLHELRVRRPYVA
jgi:hypothetical protein